MNNVPLVSVLISTYNGEKYLDETLHSVFAQTYKNYEVVVIDDGSLTDEVAKICAKYKDKLKYIRQENKGLSLSRNAGIDNSQGEYIAFIDDDDLWLPEKLEKQVAYYEELKTRNIMPGLIYTGLQYISEEGRHQYRCLIRSSGDIYRILIFKNFIGTPSSVMIARSILDDVGLFDEGIKICNDYDLWLRIAGKYKVYSLNEFLTKYRNWAASLSKNIPLITYELHLILEIILASNPGRGLSGGIKNNLTRHYKRDIATRWKNAAYEYLFDRGDAKTFRKYIRNGYQSDSTLFDLRVAIYYILSFFSVSLCQKIKRLKHGEKGQGKDKFRDWIDDVEALKYG